MIFVIFLGYIFTVFVWKGQQVLKIPATIWRKIKYGCILRVRLLGVLCHSPCPVNFGQMMSKGFLYLFTSQFLNKLYKDPPHQAALQVYSWELPCWGSHQSIFALVQWVFWGKVTHICSSVGNLQSSGNPGKRVGQCNI